MLQSSRPRGGDEQMGVAAPRTSASWSMSFPTVLGRGYTVERSASLTPFSWTAVGTIAGDGAEQFFAEPNASGVSQFYRLRVTR